MCKCLTIAAAVLTGMAAFFPASAPQAQPGPHPVVAALQIPNREAWLAACAHTFLQALESDDPLIQLFSIPGAVAMEIMVEIAPDGFVEDLSVRETSGRPSLDAAALRALSQVRQVPPFSPDMPPQNIQMQLPIGAQVS
nr:TonB family protein [Paracoccus saliphilus]